MNGYYNLIPTSFTSSISFLLKNISVSVPSSDLRGVKSLTLWLISKCLHFALSFD